MKMRPITSEDLVLLKECLSLDVESGELRWRKKIAKKIVVGSIAGRVRDDGYRGIQIMGKRFLAHRIVFAMINGKCIGEIDHINGETLDNRPSNLRVATRSQQNMNKPLAMHNKWGLAGICFHKKSGLYQSKIKANGRKISLGYYSTPEEAHKAYLAGVEKYHGEYRRAY